MRSWSGSPLRMRVVRAFGRYQVSDSYARCSTDNQDLAAQRAALAELGVAIDRIYVDHGLTGTNRARPGLNQSASHCTQIPEFRPIGINDFPGFDCRFTALKYRNVVLEFRTKFR